MNKELQTLKELTRDCKFVHLHQSISALEDKPDARLIDVLRHMLSNKAPYDAVEFMLCYIAEDHSLTLTELMDATQEVFEIYPTARYPLSRCRDEWAILRRHTSDEDVRARIERSHEKFTSLSPGDVYTRTNIISLNDRLYRVKLVSRGLSIESILAIMVHIGETYKGISKSLCVDSASNEAQDYDVYEELLRDGLRSFTGVRDETIAREYYRPLTREEFEAVRLALQITR